jgi:Putative heavy-metal-binding
LLGAVGPRPLAQVMGGSVVRVGQALLPPVPPYRRWSSSGSDYSRLEEPHAQQRAAYRRTTIVLELTVLTNAWAEARRNALNRLSEEALQVGADVVVGVELRRGEHDLAKRIIDYLISGTAIGSPDSTQKNWPLLSDLSIQDYWRLHKAGYEPAGLVAATTVMFASPSQGTRRRRMRTIQSNQELAELSQAFQLAREAVRQRLLSQGAGLPRRRHRRGRAVAHGPPGGAPGRPIGPLALAGRLEPRGAGDPVLRQASRRRRQEGMVDHDAWSRNRDPPATRRATVPTGNDDAPRIEVTSEYDPKSLEGIPESGQERLAQNRAGLYTSDLSVNEFLLVTEAGFDPVGLVVGSSR